MVKLTVLHNNFELDSVVAEMVTRGVVRVGRAHAAL